MAAALSVGPGGAHVPSVRTIPNNDRIVEASIDWRPYRDGDRVVVTLRAASPRKLVRFERLPQLHLQLECSHEPGQSRWRESPGDAKQSMELDLALVTPLTIEARLPADWREVLAGCEAARIAVLVAARPLEMPRGPGQRLERLERVAERRANTEPAWTGLVRTESVEVRFPPRGANSPPDDGPGWARDGYE
jgi:hypothetical protein